MDTTELELLGRKALQGTKARFLGVFASNETPDIDSLVTITTFPCCFISNTDPNYLPGTHWVAFYYESPRNLDFFDSYGHHPTDFSFSVPDSVHINVNNHVIQALNSQVCGHYCIFFLYFRARNYTLAYLSKLLSSASKSDSDIGQFVRKLAAILKRK